MSKARIEQGDYYTYQHWAEAIDTGLIASPPGLTFLPLPGDNACGFHALAVLVGGGVISADLREDAIRLGHALLSDKDAWADMHVLGEVANARNISIICWELDILEATKSVKEGRRPVLKQLTAAWGSHGGRPVNMLCYLRGDTGVHFDAFVGS